MKRRRDEKANGPPHQVTLAPLALAVLRELQALTGHGRDVFFSLLTGDRPISGRLVLSPTRTRYSLDDLLSGMKPGDMPTAGGWDGAAPVGQEAW